MPAVQQKAPIGLVTASVGINYVKEQGLGKFDKEKCVRFLEKFSVPSAIKLDKEDSISGNKYKEMLQNVANNVQKHIEIEIDDIVQFDENGHDLAESIENNTMRYMELFYKAIDSLLPQPSITLDPLKVDAVTVILSHRLAKQNAMEPSELDSKKAFPPSLIRKYSLSFKPSSKMKPMAVRQVKADNLGKMVKIRGIVTKNSEVKPLLHVTAYLCDKCGYEIYQEVTSDAFTPLPECPSDKCRRDNTKGQLSMQTRGSKFRKFQEADQVPMGHIPRSMSVYVFDEHVRCCNPGDHVVISGVFLPKPYTGFKAIRAGLLTDTYLLCMNIEQMKQKYTSMLLDDILVDSLLAMSKDPNIYSQLAKSIAPEIYGHEDVKKALLLLLVGGVTKEMGDGMKIRGEIHVCLMGDPGVAKSQLLKHIAKVAPRAVYTTGKGSSGVGLTASVSRDPVSDEMILEGGALVLADNGICCIDEFDKMDEMDRTAIHEVMEQQTISIAKAGIATTLNARASILAAANPLHGRYNIKKSVNDNINLPYALLSRFDIMFLIRDQSSLDDDSRLAHHVTHLHRTGAAPPLDFAVISPEILKHYIAYARRFQPHVPTSLIDYIVSIYVKLRVQDSSSKYSSYTTARTLLAVLRLSQALAKLRFDGCVSEADVNEAIRLMESAKSSIYSVESNDRDGNDPMSRIYSLVLDTPSHETENGFKEVLMENVRARIKARGFTEAQLSDCIAEFSRLGVWSIYNGNRLIIYN